MARFDKYDPKDGGFRAPLAAAVVAGQVGAVIGVGIDANGRAVVGAGNTGIKGLICPTQTMNAGDVIDIMTDGDILDMTGLTAGTNYYSDAAGALSTTNTGKYVGHTVEATRLNVRVVRA